MNCIREAFSFEPIRYPMWIRADGRSHSEESNLIVLHVLLKPSDVKWLLEGKTLLVPLRREFHFDC
jgi:hypothetical protein